MRRTLGVLALSLGLLANTSCARRLTLTPAEYERIEKRERATEDLRVYVSKKLIVLYELSDDAATYEVDKTINTSSEQNLLRVIIAKNTKGVIIDAEEKNGAPLLWVTFNSKCQDKDCAFGFVQTEDGVFRLHSVPERDGYKKPKAYFKNEKKDMKLGKLKSLAEKNDVFLWKNPRDKIFTIDLIVKKRNDTKRNVETERGGGIE
ncbi:MAG TPA: hypothetical protein VM869_15830 [Enhygromyxa sp.]|nr:hypothetical protein [Enhygromyxa sp.]